jgi:hypothetical protein
VPVTRDLSLSEYLRLAEQVTRRPAKSRFIRPRPPLLVL